MIAAQKGATMMYFKNREDQDKILQTLELNMNEEFRATLQYICHRISARGLDEVLADSFKSAALDEMSHILFFSDLITKHGGTPRFTAWNIDQSSDLKTMLEQDIGLEQAARQRYAAQLPLMGDYPELITVLESVLRDEEDHENGFAAYLAKLR